MKKFNRMIALLILFSHSFLLVSQTQKQFDSVVVSAKNNCDYQVAYTYFNKAYKAGINNNMFLLNYCCFISLLNKQNSKDLYPALNQIIKTDKSGFLSYLLIDDPDFYNLSCTKKWETIAYKVIKKTLPTADTTLALILCKIGIRDQALYTDWNCSDKKYGKKSIQSKRIIAIKDSLDKQNIKIVDSLLTTNGFPSNKKYGNLCNRIFLIIQHADTHFISKYIDTVKNACNRGDLKKECYALIYDRLNVYRNGHQFYGTQVNTEKNIPYPILDEKNVDARRKEYEMEPIKDYLLKFGIFYNPKK